MDERAEQRLVFAHPVAIAIGWASSDLVGGENAARLQEPVVRKWAHREPGSVPVFSEDR